MAEEKKTRAPRKVVTKESILEEISNVDKRIIALNSKKSKLQAKLVELNQKSILDAIAKSGKSVEEIMEFLT